MKNFLHFPLPLGLFLVLQVVGIVDKPLQADLTEQLKAQDKCLSCHQEMELLPIILPAFFLKSAGNIFLIFPIICTKPFRPFFGLVLQSI